MTTTKIAYGSVAALTWTLDSLASSTTAGRECTAIDNTSTLADDYQVLIKIVYPNSAPANNKTLYVYAGGYDATTGYAGGPVLTGSDAAYTFDADATANTPSLILAGSFWMVQNKTKVCTIPSLAAVFGGILPPKIGLVALNYSGQTLSTGCSATVLPITYTAA